LKLNFDPALPIYTQIVDGVKREIFSGSLVPGDRIPPVRELAMELGVNPNTLQRAMVELEREGLLFAERTSGRFVTTDGELIAKLRQDLVSALVKEFLQEMHALGCTSEEVEKMIAQYGGKRDE